MYMPTSKTTHRLLLIGALVGAVVFGFILVNVWNTRTASMGASFSFTSQEDTPPLFKEALITPSKVRVGDIQTLSVVVVDPKGISSVRAVTELDSRTKEIALHPTNATETAPCTECTWTAQWEVNDTSNKTYITSFIATNTDGEQRTVSIAWVDPCSPPQSGDWTLDGNCSISSVDGLEAGTLTIPSGKTLTVLSGGTWVFNEGFSILINGTIAISGGAIRRTYLWVPDQDGDGYAPSISSQVASDTQPANYIRRKDALGFDDCYDSNANVYPGQTSYFATDRGDGSFDYDCNGANDVQWGQTTSCVCDKWGCSSGTGWDGSVPACGVTATWYADSACGSVNRTQACR